ncbi:MAG: TetR family transcriptional regulator [Henriciella sp.]|nr:TetR family transcriptional regulator [Henriciella sp.]
MARRSKADAEKTRERLLEVATRLYGERGYSDTSIADICAELDITKGALFHHFKSKVELFREVWTRLQVEMDSEARAAAIAARSLTDPYAAFMAGSRTYLKYVARKDFQQIVLIDGPYVLGLRGWYESDHDLGIQNVTAGVRYLSKKGLVAPENVEPIAIMLQSALNGAGFALLRGDDDGASSEDFYKAFETLVKSLR